MATNKQPTVSVVVITYNQEKYIRKSLEGILSQKTDFEYELIIGEDCSTDRTRDICVQYSQEFPEKIRLLLHQQNIGMHQNAIQTLRSARGKYIAFCEGDDFWTDPNKLQMQYDFLENNLSFTGVHTKVDYVDKDGRKIGTGDMMPADSDIIDFNYLLQRNVIHTCSFMFRKSVLDETVYSIMGAVLNQDYTLFLAVALNGNIYYFRNTTAAYRKGVGVTATWIFSNIRKQHLMIFSLFEKHYNLKKYRAALYAAKQFQYYHVFSASNKETRLLRCRYFCLLLWYFFLSLLYKPAIKVYKISFTDIVMLAYKARPKLKKWLKLLFGNMPSSDKN
ncbi:MAG: glycosyltransferase [Phycisphaerae bacterium]|nr:glycosyltransferase [Phycisphaerae bacterium]